MAIYPFHKVCTWKHQLHPRPLGISLLLCKRQPHMGSRVHWVHLYMLVPHSDWDIHIWTVLQSSSSVSNNELYQYSGSSLLCWTHCTCASIEAWLHFITVIKLLFTIGSCVARWALTRRSQQSIMTGTPIHTWLRGTVIYVHTTVMTMVARRTVTFVAQRTLRVVTNTVLCASMERIFMVDCTSLCAVYTTTMNTNMWIIAYKWA